MIRVRLLQSVDTLDLIQCRGERGVKGGEFYSTVPWTTPRPHPCHVLPSPSWSSLRRTGCSLCDVTEGPGAGRGKRVVRGLSSVEDLGRRSCYRLRRPYSEPRPDTRLFPVRISPPLVVRRDLWQGSWNRRRGPPLSVCRVVLRTSRRRPGSRRVVINSPEPFDHGSSRSVRRTPDYTRSDVLPDGPLCLT